jgi:DNA-binding NtrC family response regulator
MPKILVVDDDAAVRTSLSLLFKQAGYDVLCAQDPTQTLALFDPGSVDLVIMDMNFTADTSGQEGLRLLHKLKTLSSKTPIVVITAWGSISLAVDGMKAGAADFFTKPWNNEHLLGSVATALSLYRKGAKATPKDLTRGRLDEQYDFSSIIGQDAAFLSVLDTVGRVASTDAPVLIVGDSGTGKELIAEAIHRNSDRRDGPFVKVNLGGIPRNLFESEMFGHKRGAFTDAKHDRKGRFELAHKGTIFLDEIGDLDLNSQVKLLRVLQDRSFEVLGSSTTKTVDVRVISATNRPLEKMVEDGEFREDLFYRINLITVTLPPLRERPADIPLLLRYYVARLKNHYPDQQIVISERAIQWLQELPWPGNVRELKNLVERTLLICDKRVLDVDDFRAQLSVSPKREAQGALPAIGTMTLEDVEKRMIQKALDFHQHNVSKVADALGISRGALYRKMDKYGISR